MTDNNATTTATPALGATVLYRLTQDDAEKINKRRADHYNFGRTLGQVLFTGHVGHTGNSARADDLAPAIVVRAFDEPSPSANLQVLLDGNDTYWATSRSHGMQAGQWRRLGETDPAA